MLNPIEHWLVWVTQVNCRFGITPYSSSTLVRFISIIGMHASILSKYSRETTLISGITKGKTEISFFRFDQ